MTGKAHAEDDRIAHPRPRFLDVILGVGVTLIVSLFIAADIENADPDGWAYLWAFGLGGLMLARRRYPVVVVVLSAAAVLSYYAAGYPAIGVAVPLAAAVFSAAERGRMTAAIITSAALLLISVAYRLAAGQDPAVVVGYDLPGHALLLGGAIAFGDSVRSRRSLRQQASEIASLVAERSLREAEKQTMSERLAIARELHDSVGHALTVVTLHTQIAEETLDADERPYPDDATIRDSLRVISETASGSFEELRRTVARLRKEDGAGHAAPRLSELETAIRPARQSGLTVHTHVSVPSPLPPGVEEAIYRIVQESITNVVRHAAASRVDVNIIRREGHVDVSVVNDGVGDRTPADPRNRVWKGRGLAGMQERVLLLGGSFSAGREASGFAVRASLPAEAAS
ncbi:sensor histidine kinase [Microbacterium sp.]|uniref:sensor histidine kinase n=1 Tax=Microbacterium sp. TaxID=51671 RepID=UPI002812202F|nr:sensor histidine kinase [Microbacterium sp.]